MKHPAREIEFDALLASLEKAHEERLVKKHIGDEGLHLYCYSEVCTYDKKWDATTLMARGLILDVAGKQVAATPFIKFFNYGEGGYALPNTAFEVFEKLDGSLIILFYHNGKWKTATKGSLNSEQAKWAQKWLQDYDLHPLVEGTTYLLEAVYPQNRIVVHYPESKLVLLGAHAADGTEYTYSELEVVGLVMDWDVAERYNYSSLDDLVAVAAALKADKEGFVVRFSNGLRVKIKGDEYCRVHRLISRITPLAMWEALEAGDDLNAIRRQLPEEFWVDFDRIIFLLQAQIGAVLQEVSVAAAEVADKSDKEVGLMLDKFAPAVRSFIFPYRKHGGDLLKGKVRALLFRTIRPTGNVLLGYEPSLSVNRFAESAE